MTGILNQEVFTATPGASLASVVSIMKTERISCIIIVAEDNKPVGIVTERDIVRAACVDLDFDDVKVSVVMNSPVITAPHDVDVFDVYNRFVEHRIRHLALVDHWGTLKGVLTQTDVIKALDQEFFMEFKGVETVMATTIVSLYSDSTLREALSAMSEKSISCVVITDSIGAPVGVVTERDILRLADEGAAFDTLTVGDVMSSPVVTINIGEALHSAVDLMGTKKLRRLIVVDENGKLKGLVTQFDVVKGLETQYIRSLKEVVRSTEEKLKETVEELNEKSTYLENILASATEYSIITTDMKLNVNYYNPAALKMFSMTSEELKGKTILTIHDNESVDPDRLDKALELVIRTGSHRYEITETAEDGTERTLDARLSSIVNAEGHHVGFAHFSKDVTDERKRAAEFRKLSHALAHSPSVVVITDTEGIIEYVNPRFTELTGYSSEEAIGKYPSILKSGKTNKEDYEELWETIKSGKEWRGLFYNRKKNGECYWESAAISPVKNPEGEVTHYIALKEDITKRLKIEGERERLILELEEALKSIKSLKGLLPICSYCKKIRDDKGYWKKVETYISERSDAEFTHGICEDCSKALIERS